MNRRALASLWFVAALAGCGNRVVDIRPWVAHPDQKLESEDVVVAWQNRVRVSLRYMRDRDLDAIFRLPGKAGGNGNPFLHQLPLAPARFTVFRIDIRNESEFDTFVEFNKILLRNERGDELRPLTQQQLIEYWIGRVTIEPGRPITWSAQMDAARRREEKEKSLVVTVYEGGRLPTRGEHHGYLVFRDLPEGGDPSLCANYTKESGLVRFLPTHWLFGASKPKLLGCLQLDLEVVTRASRYGNALGVALEEFNFSRLRVPAPPENEEELRQWRNENETEE